MTDQPPSRRRRLQGFRVASRFVGAGLLDQVVIATANAANTLLGGILLPKDQFGALALALSVGYFSVYLNRAFVGDVLLALASRFEGEHRGRLIRNGLATAFCSGVTTMVVFVVLWLAWPHNGKIDLDELIWLVPFTVPLMLHDTARCDYLADRRPEKALGIDLVWFGTQGVAIIVMILTAPLRAPAGCSPRGASARPPAPPCTCCASAGCRGAATRRRGSPRPGTCPAGSPSTAIVAQLQVLSISFLVAGKLSKIDLGNLRFVQTVQLQPVQNLVAAIQGLLVPRASRAAADAAKPGPEGADAAATLRRQTRQLAIAFAVLGALMVLIVWPLVSCVLTTTGKFAEAAPLALPIALQGAVYLLQVPFTAAMRGMHRARMLFVQYVVFATVSLTGLSLGASQGLQGAAWGLLTGSATGLVCMVILYGYALKTVIPPTTTPATRFDATQSA